MREVIDFGGYKAVLLLKKLDKTRPIRIIKNFCRQRQSGFDSASNLLNLFFRFISSGGDCENLESNWLILRFEGVLVSLVCKVGV